MAQPILIVDDDPEVCRVLTSALEQHGFATFSVGNGREALAAVARSRPGLILLDLVMPIMTGWEFLAVAPADIPLIVISGYIHDAITMSSAAMIRRPFGFMSKPVNVHTLLAVTRQLYGAEPSHRTPRRGGASR